MCFGCTREGTALFLARFTAGQGGFGGHQIGGTFYELHTVLLVPVQFVSRRTGTFITAQGVEAARFTATLINAALVDISAVSHTVEDVAFMTVALETPG